MFGTREDDVGRLRVVWATVVAHDPIAERGAVIYLPAHTAVEIPGRGLQGLSDAYSSGGASLLLVSVENLLNMSIDHYLGLSQADARLIFKSTGPMSVDVPAEVRVPAGPNRARLIFTQGLQRLPAASLVSLLYVIGLGGDDAELASRHLAFWDALFESFQSDPAALQDAIERADGAVADSDARPAEIGRLFASLTAVRHEERMLGVLPVTQVGAGGEELYEVDDAEAARFLASLVGEVARPEDESRVQILNGNGVPGIGERVGQRLVGHGFRVVLSANARRLNYETTLIIAYESTPEALAEAERARELLGVGQVQVAAQSQGIVNLTVVIGRDFLRKD
ncbi:MAG: LCP family protein [Actinomycetota bacterium]